MLLVVQLSRLGRELCLDILKLLLDSVQLLLRLRHLINLIAECIISHHEFIVLRDQLVLLAAELRELLTLLIVLALQRI